jgi:hypothetical protein
LQNGSCKPRVIHDSHSRLVSVFGSKTSAAVITRRAAFSFAADCPSRIPEKRAAILADTMMMSAVLYFANDFDTSKELTTEHAIEFILSITVESFHLRIAITPLRVSMLKYNCIGDPLDITNAKWLNISHLTLSL